MLGLGSLLVSGSVIEDLNDFVVFKKQINFASDDGGFEARSSNIGTTTIANGQTADGGTNNDWLKVTFGADQTSTLCGIQNGDFFDGAFDFTNGQFVAVFFDVFLSDGFAGEDGNTPPVSLRAEIAGKNFSREADGSSGVSSTNALNLNYGIANNAGDRYRSITSSTPPESLLIKFNSSNDSPVNGDFFFVRNIRVVAATKDLGTFDPFA
tara:strand:- start:3021 stop:3650 length:630 start_codon:yes stop_codon:yes gene_type:complete